MEGGWAPKALYDIGRTGKSAKGAARRALRSRCCTTVRLGKRASDLRREEAGAEGEHVRSGDIREV